MQAVRASFDDFATPKDLSENFPAWFRDRFTVRNGGEKLTCSLKELRNVTVGPTVRAVHHVTLRVVGLDLRGSLSFGGERHRECHKRFVVVNRFEEFKRVRQFRLASHNGRFYDTASCRSQKSSQH